MALTVQDIVDAFKTTGLTPTQSSFGDGKTHGCAVAALVLAKKPDFVPYTEEHGGGGWQSMFQKLYSGHSPIAIAAGFDGAPGRGEDYKLGVEAAKAVFA